MKKKRNLKRYHSNIEDVMAAAEQRFGVPLRRKSEKEACGPCPFCKTGIDRFIVWRDGGYWCRQCNKSGRIETSEALDYCYVPPPIEPPSRRWQERALFHIHRSSFFLYGDARDYLNNRGIADSTIEEFDLGFNPINTFDHPSLWGLDGGFVFVPKGIIIPWFVGDEVWGIKIRRLGHRPKYGAPRGVKTCLFGRFTGKSALLLTEGEFDMLVAWQEVSDLVDVATMGSMTVLPRGRWLKQILRYKKVLIAYDMDNETYKWRLKEWIGPTAHVLGWDNEKDLNDYFIVGGDIGRLIKDAL